MTILETKPKYQQLKEILLDRIKSGEYVPKKKFPSENELLKEFAVSKHTVLKALNELVNENYLHRRQGSGTFIKSTSPRQNNLSNVALLHYSKTQRAICGTSLQSLEGIEKRISFDNKYTLTFKATNGIPENEIKSINRLAENSRGIIIVTLFYRNKENHAIDLLLKKNIPFVNILTQPEERYLNKINSVVPDDYNGGYLAGKHLAETGCERFYALIPEKSKLSIENYRLRLEGFRKALSETGLESELSIKCVRLKTDMFPFERAGFEFGHKLIQNPPERKTGVFTLCSDSYASGLLKALKDNNISVPEHISVCGYDNLAESTPWANDITTIDTSPRTLGYRATEILLNAIESENTAPPENINIPVKLIKRNSTG